MEYLMFFMIFLGGVALGCMVGASIQPHAKASFKQAKNSSKTKALVPISAWRSGFG